MPEAGQCREALPGVGVDHGKPRFSPRIPVAPGRRSRRPASRGTGTYL